LATTSHSEIQEIEPGQPLKTAIGAGMLSNRDRMKYLFIQA
jgi:hypothetical protein